jgi:hypothetical protein
MLSNTVAPGNIWEHVGMEKVVFSIKGVRKRGQWHAEKWKPTALITK